VIVTLTWKEYREQSPIWVALAVLAVALLAGLTAFLAPQGEAAAGPDQAALLIVAAAALAVTCGLVCGALMLAGEAEAGTLPFLDTLPALRRHLWAAKLLAGLSLTLLQGLLLGGVAAGLGLHGGLNWSAPHEAVSRWDWLWVLPAVALEAYCWGLLGSALCRNVLTAVVLATGVLAVPWLLATPPTWREYPLVLLVRAGLDLAALALSALVFTQPDRERRLAPTRVARRAAAPSRPSAIGVLLWLAARQGSGWLLALGAAGFVSALLLAGYGLVFWPVLTLVVGAVCGSTVFLGEQSEGTYRFLGDQRLSPGRVWLWKTAFWLAAAVGISGLVLMGGVLHAGIGAEHGAGRAGPPDAGLRWLILVPPAAAAGLWLLHGFAIAQTCSLVWRRSVAALFMALILAAAVGGAWAPSLLGGGLPSWQVFVVPALLLAFNRLAMRPWLGGQFYTWRPLTGLAVCAGLAVAWTAACLGYRVLEVPAAGEPFDVRAFVASLPPPEQNQAGSLIRQAVSRLGEAEARAARPAAPQDVAPAALPLRPAGAPPAPPAPPNYHGEVAQVIQRGWAGRDQDFDRWLDALFQGDWADTLRQGAALPPGMVVDPRQMTVYSNRDVLEQCHWAGNLFSVRALQLQARGDDRAALDHLTTALALSRQLRNRAVPLSWQSGLAVERAALEGLGHWLERVGPKPDLLRRALDEVSRHEEALPPPDDAVKADYLTLEDAVDDPAELLRLDQGPGRSPAQHLTHDLLLTAWQAPWEKARAERIVRGTVAGRLRGVRAGYAAVAARLQAEEAARLQAQDLTPLSPGERALEGWLPAAGGLEGAQERDRLARFIGHSWMGDVLMLGPDLPLIQAAGLCQVRGTRLQLALALYQVREGKPAESLDALVPRYLAALPSDPFSPEAQGFSYRVSEGEDIEFPLQTVEGGDEAVRHVAAGEGVVWSNGVDLTDDGGRRQWAAASLPAPQPGRHGTDWIFLVPRWKKR
jgi:hypothetical protein